MASVSLPTSISRIAAELAALPGVVAVVLGGSRATATHRPDSDWDLSVYYRSSQRPFDPADLRRLGYAGYVSELGEWGPIVNAGAWLTVEDLPVDVLLRDLDVVEGWLRDAQDGRYEVLSQTGYVVGAPTYVPVGELAVSQPIIGELPRPTFPDRLAGTAPTRWKGRASVSLMFAWNYACAGNVVCCTGMVSDAVLCVAHARHAERHEWVLSEKYLVERASLDNAHALLAQAGETASELQATVVDVSDLLRVRPLTSR
jgi:predicted nucleotidyltransferase